MIERDICGKFIELNPKCKTLLVDAEDGANWIEFTYGRNDKRIHYNCTDERCDLKVMKLHNNQSSSVTKILVDDWGMRFELDHIQRIVTLDDEANTGEVWEFALDEWDEDEAIQMVS